MQEALIALLSDELGPEKVILEAQRSRGDFGGRKGPNPLVEYAMPASNLDPAVCSHPDFPMSKAGSIDLSVLFNDPLEKE